MVRELEKAEPGGAGGGAIVPPEGQSKREAIAEAGLSKTTANRYEQLAGPRDQRAQNAGKAASEAYFAKARQQTITPR
jgi:hypothetical protein